MNNPDARGVSDAEWDAYERARATEEAAFDELLNERADTRRRNASGNDTFHQLRLMDAFPRKWDDFSQRW